MSDDNENGDQLDVKVEQDSLDDIFTSVANGENESDQDVTQEEQNLEDEREDQNDDATAEPSELEQLRAANVALNHKINSDSGRVSALQRKVNDLQQQPQVTSPIVDATPQATPDDESYLAFTEDYPELVSGVDGIVAKALKQQEQEMNEKLNQVLQPLYENAEQSRLNQEEDDLRQYNESVVAGRSQLDKDVPNWQDTVKSDDYLQWLSQQPSQIVDMTESNNITLAKNVLTLYGASRSNAVTAEAQEKRSRQLADQAGVRSRSAGASDPRLAELDGFEAAFQKEANKT